jgi:hypothetical protein
MTIRIDDAVRLHMLADKAQQGLGYSVGGQRRVHLTAAFELAKDDGIAGSDAASFASPHAAKITLIDLPTAVENGRLLGQMTGVQLAQVVVRQCCGVMVYPASGAAVRAGGPATDCTIKATELRLKADVLDET